MTEALVRKILEDYNKNSSSSFINYILILVEFVSKIFYWLSYNKEVSGPLAASFLLNLPNYYSLKAIVKTINPVLLKIKFQMILSG